MISKRFRIPVLAFCLGLFAAFGFKPASHNASAVAGERWYFYTDATHDHNLNNPNNYQLTGNGGMDDPGCSGSGARCAVFVLPDTQTPTIPDATSLQGVSGSNIRKKV
jgi:hypothetical protein